MIATKVSSIKYGESQQGPHVPEGEQLLEAIAAAVALIAMLLFIVIMFAVINGV